MIYKRVMICLMIGMACLFSDGSLLQAEEVAIKTEGQTVESSIARIKGELNEANAAKSNAVKDSFSNWNTADEIDMKATSGRMFKALAFCAGLFLIGASLFQRFRKGQQLTDGRRLKVIERISLGPKSSLLLTEVDGQALLVSVGQDQVSIHRLPGSCYDQDRNFEESIDLVCQEEIRMTA